MKASENSIEEMHEVLSIFQFIDVGLVVLDLDCQITLWNNFMENHSGLRMAEVRGKNIYELFPDISREWLGKKIDSVIQLNNRSFSIWKQRPFLMMFRSDRPITGRSEFMYQNVTIFPLVGLNGQVGKICMIVYDVTDTALHEQAIQEANKNLKELSQIDGLTQLMNRRTWEELLSMEYKRLHRNQGVSSLVMFDIDHFKRVNDNYGHQAGDDVIKMVSRVLREQKRETDIAGRYGGEEFGVVLPDTDADGAMVFCERLRKAIEAEVVVFEGQPIPVTVSLGIAPYITSENEHERWLQCSDEALYQSKEGGRNMTTVFKAAD